MFQCSSNIHKPLYSIPQKHHQVRRHSPSWHPTLQIHTSHTSSPDLSLANWVACNPYERAGLILATIYSTLSKTHIKLSVLRRKFVLNNQVPPPPPPRCAYSQLFTHFELRHRFAGLLERNRNSNWINPALLCFILFLFGFLYNIQAHTSQRHHASSERPVFIAGNPSIIIVQLQNFKHQHCKQDVFHIANLYNMPSYWYKNAPPQMYGFVLERLVA